MSSVMDQVPLTPFQETLAVSYDRMFDAGCAWDGRMESGYANLGLFLPDTADYITACENLMKRLLALFERHQGPVLDVGCGLGATTQYLTRHYPADQVHGVNISASQLEACRRRLPGSHFHLMAAEQLGFSDATFNALVSVEAAPHFRGRREFLREACRVLKPGGELAVADMLFHDEPRSFSKFLSGQELYRNLDEYRALWKACGFHDIVCEDVTQPCWRGFVDHVRGGALRDLATGRIDGPAFAHLLKFAYKLANLPVTAYVLAHAKKPECGAAS